MSENPYTSPAQEEVGPIAPPVSLASRVIPWLAVGFVVLVLGAVLLPVRRSAPEAARRVHCQNNLRQIALALHNYHDTYGSLPPAYTCDEKGNRLHSWRTLILPYIEEGTLYKKIDLSKPWDDPANLAVTQNVFISTYFCASARADKGKTPYVVVVAPGACFSGAEPRKFSDVRDGLSNTLLVMEVDAAHAVPWMSPNDTDEQTLLSLAQLTKVVHSGIIQTALADGSARSVSQHCSPKVWQALISIEGNDPEALKELD